MLLWKGIAKYAAQKPGYPVIFGAVSNSNNYSAASRQLMVEYLEGRTARDPLRFLVRPRRPFRAPLLAGQEMKNFAKCAGSLEGLSAAVDDVEADGRRIPVLLRQYAKLGGRVLTFNVDHDFAGALDGLMLTNLRMADPVALKKYMGAGSFAAFQAGRALADRYGITFSSVLTKAALKSVIETFGGTVGMTLVTSRRRCVRSQKRVSARCRFSMARRIRERASPGICEAFYSPTGLMGGNAYAGPPSLQPRNSCSGGIEID